MRICDICGVIDDGPRHLIAHAPGEVQHDPAMVMRVANVPVDLLNDAVHAAYEALQDTTLQIRHPACCARAGCDICKEN